MRSPVIRKVFTLLGRTVSFGINIIIATISGLDLLIHIRAATIFTH